MKVVQFLMRGLTTGFVILCRVLPMQKTVVFESSPDYACNTYPVFLQMKKEKPDYKAVWYTSRKTPKDPAADDVCYYDALSFWDVLKREYYLNRAAVLVSCNRILEKKRKDQISLFLCHGSKTKKTRGTYEVGDGVDYVNVQSHFFDDIITYEYNCPKEKLVYLGYPRCDSFFSPEALVSDIKQKLELTEEQKYFVWLPTFRKHKNPNVQARMDTQKYNNMGMPLVYDNKSLCLLDKFLCEKNMVIFYKPHPAQDVTGLVNADTRYVRIISDSDLSGRHISLYDLLAGSDGLITDYSSVFFDYLLADKPIATTTDDMEEWKKMTGFAFDLDAFLDEATVRVPNLEALIAFLEDTNQGRDEKTQGRKRIRELTNIWYDGNSAIRTADFLMKKIEKKHG